MAYFPLAGGLLTGKYRRGEPAPEGTRLASWGRELLSDETFDEVEKLESFAAEHGRSLHELAIAAAYSTPGVASVLIGATSAKQVEANAAVDWVLDADTLAALPRVEGRGLHSGRPRR